jgi:hypothetical protein
MMVLPIHDAHRLASLALPVCPLPLTRGRGTWPVSTACDGRTVDKGAT